MCAATTAQNVEREPEFLSEVIVQAANRGKAHRFLLTAAEAFYRGPLACVPGHQAV
jgi:hypothetical protein